MVSIRNDPYSTPTNTIDRAQQWGANHECWGALGHLNLDNSLEDWP